MLESLLGAMVGAMIGIFLMNVFHKARMKYRFEALESSISPISWPPPSMKSQESKRGPYAKPDPSKGRTPKVNDEMAAWMKENDL